MPIQELHNLVPSSESMRELALHRWALVIAHPGHELRVFHFLESTRPLVAVLTDGSGSHGVSRLHQTSRGLDEAGAGRDVIFGELTDRDAYAALMARDATPFADIARRLSVSLQEQQITAVLTDAAEGYNPVHDVCRCIAEAAIQGMEGPRPLLFEFDLVGHPDGEGGGFKLKLDDGAFARKLSTAHRYRELVAEAGAAFDQHGMDAFRTEFLRQAVYGTIASPDYTPYYEQVGQERVRQGRYQTALRFSEHVRPVLASLLSPRISSGHVALDTLH